MGCRGGGTDSAIDYYKTSAAMLESDYPYVSRDQICQYSYSSKNTGINVTRRVNVQPYSTAQLKSAVAQQPVAAAVAGSSSAFLQYKSGVFDSAQCGVNLDHAVVLVGFGTDPTSGSEYWIVRNDWGLDWGE